MRFVFFCQSLVSDWNNPGAHLLRGVAAELLESGHGVQIYEPADGWSLHNLLEQGGAGLLKAFSATYPQLRSHFYDPQRLDLDQLLDEADVVIVHEWSEPELLRQLSRHRAHSTRYKLLFHDAPHRSLQQPRPLRATLLSHFDGILAASDSLRRLYHEQSWADHVWLWRDAVDTRIFRPVEREPLRSFDVVWVGNWGQATRASELNEFLIAPIRALGLHARLYGCRYPEDVLHTLRACGADYGGWLPDFGIPSAYATGRIALHVPRRMHGEGLPHTPTLRILQALACGMPVVSAPWSECDAVFAPGRDFLVAGDGAEMSRHIAALLDDPQRAAELAAHGMKTVTERHTCADRARELLLISHELGAREIAQAALRMRAPRAARRAARSERSHVAAAWN